MVIKGKLSNSFVERQMLFKGIYTNIESELLPDGFLPEATNVDFNNEGKIVSVKSPAIVGTQINTSPIKAIFKWKKDNNKDVLLAQAGTGLYKYTGSSWSLVKNFTTSERLAFSGGFFDTLYIMHHTDGFYTWDGNTTPTFMPEAPRSKYLFLWTGYLFAGGDLYENKTTTPTDYSYAPFRVRWSPTVDNAFDGWYEVYEYGGETVNNFIDFRTPENSNITGMGLWNRRIVIFTQNSIEELYGYQPEAFQVNTIYKGHLSAVDNAIAYYDYVYYLSPEGLCVMGKDAIKIGDTYKSYWKSSATYYSLTEYTGKIIGNQDSDIMVYDTYTKTFEHYIPTFKTTYVYSSSDTLYVGSTDGKVYQWGAGSDYMPWSFKTKTMTFGRSDRYKRPVQITIIHDPATVHSTVTVKGIFDGVEKTIGTFDPYKSSYSQFWVSEPLFKSLQLSISGSSEIAIQEIDVLVKVRGVGYV